MTHTALPAIAGRIRAASDNASLASALDEAEEALGVVLALGYPAATHALAAQAFDDADAVTAFTGPAREVAVRRLAVVLDAVAELVK